jgi:hypothetical protein
VSDAASITYAFGGARVLITANVYDLDAHSVRQIASVMPSSAQGVLVWNGLDDWGLPAAPGLYVVHVEALDEATNNTTAVQRTVVVSWP